MTVLIYADCIPRFYKSHEFLRKCVCKGSARILVWECWDERFEL